MTGPRRGNFSFSLTAISISPWAYAQLRGRPRSGSIVCLRLRRAVWGVETFRRIFPDALVDGLTQSWTGERCFMNPPYSRKIGAWIAKARREAERGALVVGLLPARTDTAWFYEHVYPHAHIEFLRGRIKFEGTASSAPFPSMIAVWGKACTGVRE